MNRPGRRIVVRNLLFATVVLSCVPAWAQDAIPPFPNEPLIPTSSDECVDFQNAYQKVIDKIGDAKLKCIDAHPNGLFDRAAAPMSCIEGGWASGKSTVMRACARVEDQWCRATVDRQKRFDECMAQVEENKKKKEIMDEVILHKKPDREKTQSDDEIDNAFKAIDKSTDKLHEGQNDLVKKYEETGVDTIKAMEKQAFSELDKAFRDADFAELTRASQARPAPTPPHLAQSKTELPTLRETAWSATDYDPNIGDPNQGGRFTRTVHFYGDGRVTMEQPSFNASNPRLIYEGTWRQTDDGAVVEWRVVKMPDVCGTSYDGVGALHCEEAWDGDPEHFVFKGGDLDGTRWGKFRQ